MIKIKIKFDWIFRKSSYCFLLVAACVFPGVSLAHADAYKDIYLTQNRICKACRWEAVDEQSLRLISRNGERVVVPKSEVLGMDRHPVWRRLVYKSLHGIGLPGKVIVPGAFEDGWEFACKYCDPL